MTICDVFQIYLAMASVHMDTATNHVKIVEGGKALQAQCEKFQKEQKKDKKKDEVGERSIEK